ncbi:hypothetical protein Tco_0528816 [Tanacetum coccineum]
MVAYLQKSEGSEGFHQIVDFLTASHIRYALTESPTIYVSLIEQFWQTATASTLENGDMEIIATIDGKVNGNMKKLPRDYTGLWTLFCFKTMLVQGSDFSRETEVPRPSSLTQTHVANEAASTCVDVRHGGAANTDSSLDAGQGNDRVVSLETNLQRTKKVYGAAYTNLIKKVKRLEDKLNKSRRKRRLFLSEEEDSDTEILTQKDPSKQGRKIAQINDDEGITLVQMGAQTQGRHDHEMEADFEFTTAEDISTATVSLNTTAAKVLADVARKRREVANATHYTKRRRTISTASGDISTAEEPVITAGVVQET